MTNLVKIKYKTGMTVIGLLPEYLSIPRLMAQYMGSRKRYKGEKFTSDMRQVMQNTITSDKVQGIFVARIITLSFKFCRRSTNISLRKYNEVKKNFCKRYMKQAACLMEQRSGRT